MPFLSPVKICFDLAELQGSKKTYFKHSLIGFFIKQSPDVPLARLISLYVSLVEILIQ